MYTNEAAFCFSVYFGIYIVRLQNGEKTVIILVKPRHFMIMQVLLYQIHPMARQQFACDSIYIYIYKYWFIEGKKKVLRQLNSLVYIYSYILNLYICLC